YAPARASRLAQAALLVLFVPVAWIGHEYGQRNGRERFEVAQRLEQDLLEGAELDELARRHWASFYTSQAGFLVHLRLLRDTGIPPFDRAVEGSRPPEVYALVRRMLALAPSLVASPLAPRERTIDGRPALAIRARCELRFALPSGARRLRAQYGVLPASYGEFVPEEERTDGLRFTVELV